MAVDQSLVELRYEALMTSNNSLYTNSHFVVLTNVVCVLTLALCSFLSLSAFIPGSFLSFMFYQFPIDVFQWRRQIGSFNDRSSFSGCKILFGFSIISLLKLLIKLLCCFRGESHIDFRKQCIIMTQGWGRGGGGS